MIAVIPVRNGELPIGAEEAVAEACGTAVLVGDGADAAASSVGGSDVRVAELGPFAPGAFAAALAPFLAEHDVVILPASADGRDLAPRLAHLLDRPLLAGAIEITPERVVVVRQGGLVAEEHVVLGPIVATLEPGSRGVDTPGGGAAISTLGIRATAAHDAQMIEVVHPDPAMMDLSEATRIAAGGAGLGGAGPFEELRSVAAALGCSWGASRVAADAGWVPQDRFIGTTGVTVDPDIYVAFGISGAVQHVSGLGHPGHIIAVNTDPSAPMMAMADLAIVSDAVAVLNQLARRLGVAHD